MSFFFLSLFWLGSGCGESGLTMKAQTKSKGWERKISLLLRRETPTNWNTHPGQDLPAAGCEPVQSRFHWWQHLKSPTIKTFIEAVGPDHPSWRMKDQDITTDDTQPLPPQSIPNALLISDGGRIKGSFLKCNLVGLHFQSRRLVDRHHYAQVWDIDVLESSWGMEEGYWGYPNAISTTLSSSYKQASCSINSLWFWGYISKN